MDKVYVHLFLYNSSVEHNESQKRRLYKKDDAFLKMAVNHTFLFIS